MLPNETDEMENLKKKEGESEETSKTEPPKETKTDETDVDKNKDKTPKGFKEEFDESKTDNGEEGENKEGEKKDEQPNDKKGVRQNTQFEKNKITPKTGVLLKTLKKINALGFETTAVFAGDACAASAISPTRVYSVLIDAIISLIHDLTQTRINIHPSVILNDILNPTVCSVIATSGSKIVTNYVKVMSQVANAGAGGVQRTTTLGFISEAIASMSSQGARRFNAEDVLDALRMAAILRPMRGADVVTDWTRPAQTMEQNIPHKLFTDSANFVEVLALSNALNQSGDIVDAIQGRLSHENYLQLRNDIISTISELNTMSMMTINAKGLAASICSPELIHLAATFSKRDFSTETRTGCFSLSVFDLLLFLQENGHIPTTVNDFLTDIDNDDFITRAHDSMLFQNGIDITENFANHPSGSLQYDFTAIKTVLEPEEVLNMEQLIYLAYQTYFEEDPLLHDAVSREATLQVTNTTTYTYEWFNRLSEIYKFLYTFKQIYVDDVRSKVVSGNPLESLIERQRTTDPISESVISSLLKLLSTLETSNRTWATICITFNNLIIEEGREFSETEDWPLTVDKRRAVRMVLDKFVGYRVPTHYQRFSFNPLLVEPSMFVLRNPQKTNWMSNPGTLRTLGSRGDLIWVLRPSYVSLIRTIGYYMLTTRVDRPTTPADIVRLNSSFTIDALDQSFLKDTKTVEFEELYDTYSFNDVANRQIISSISDVIITLEQPHLVPLSNSTDFRLDVHRMFANCVELDRLREISNAIVEVATMAGDHLNKSLYITDDLETTVQRQFASVIGGAVSTLNNKISRSGVLSLSRTDIQDWDSTATRMIRAKVHLVNTPIYRQTVSDILRTASSNMGMSMFPIDANLHTHLHVITDVFNVLLRMQHPDAKSFTREILTYLSLPFDLDPSTLYIDITARHLFTANSMATATEMQDLVIAQDLVIFNKSVGQWYNQDVLINEPIEAERALLPLMIDIVSDKDTDELLAGLFQNAVLKQVMAGSVSSRTPSYVFHLSVSNQNRIVYRGSTMLNIVRK